jgi:hypothetical protein
MLQNVRHRFYQAGSEIAKAEIHKNYCATNSGSPEVELRFCPWLIMFKY